MIPILAPTLLSSSSKSAPPVAPVNLTLPTISDTDPFDGELLTAGNGTWTGHPTSFTYQWFNVNGLVFGANASTYLVSMSDWGGSISVEVTATNNTGSTSATSLPTATVIQPPVNTQPPNVTSTGDIAEPLVGDTLETDNGSWDNNPTGFAYQWWNTANDSGAPIAGATGSAYTIQSSDINLQVFCIVTASNPAAAVAAQSNSTGTVAGS